MDFMIFDSTETLLYIRNDALDAVYTEQEYSLYAKFPLTEERLMRGMKIGFVDQENIFQLFEIRQVDENEPDEEQAITCEHVAVAELTDEIIEDTSPTNTTAASALVSLLAGTNWSAGTTVSSSTDSMSAYYTNVWSAICTLRDTWGVRIRPRVTVSATEITGKYIDLRSNIPTNRGVRLEINKNIKQIGVIYDDRNVYTALYGRGKGQSTLAGDTNNAAKLTFEDVIWTTAGGDPANKPSGQRWVEDVAATALYGRNGRKRTGVAEFSDIEDAEELLQATWDYLQTVNKPAVTIDCRMIDLYAYGYEHEQILLGDEVNIIVDPLNVELQGTVIKMSRDLLRPENTNPTIGSYKSDIASMMANNNAVSAYVSKLKASNPDLVNGVINTMVTAILSSGTNFYTDPNDGGFVWESADHSTAVKITGGGILLASAKVGGVWQWRTAVTGAAIVADEILTGTLHAALVTILGNEHFYWDASNIYIVNPTDANIQIRIGLYDGTNYGIAYTRDGGSTWVNKIGFDGATFSYKFGVINSDGKNLLSITETNDETGQAGGLLKLGDTNTPVDLDDSTVWQPKNGGTGYSSGQVHRIMSVPSDSLGIDGDIAVRYSGGGGGFADIYPSIGAHTTNTYFGKTREWNYERISGWRSVGNTSGALTGSFWSFTTPAAGMSFATLTFTCGKYIGGVWYGWNLSLPITVGVFSGTGSSTPLATGTFTPSNTPDSVSIPLSFSTPLTGSTTYYLAIYDNAAAYNKSRALIQASTVVLTGDASDTPVGIYVKAGGTYVDVTAAVLALLNDHIADTDNPHSVTASQAGAVPTSRTVNSKALSSNITLDASDVGAVPTSRTVNGHALSSNVTVTLSDVGGAAASHAHGNITSDGKIGSEADQILVTGTGGGVTLASPGVLKLLLAIAMSDVGTTAGITDIQVGTGDPGTLATGVLYLKREA